MNFEKIYEIIKSRSLVCRPRCKLIFDLINTRAKNLNGSCAEFGVYKGGSAKLIHSQIASSVKLYLFDTFEGMPEHESIDVYHKGDFSDTSLAHVQRFLGDSPNIIYKQGYFPDTAKGLETEKFAFVHIDCDQYKSILDACNFFYPKMVYGGIIVIDDYGFLNGTKKAVDEFFSDKPEKVIVENAISVYVIKN
jgi:hypothetical protein